MSTPASHRAEAQIEQLDLDRIAVAARAGGPMAILPVLAAIAQRAVGHRMLTVMRLHEPTMELERIYSTLGAYPPGARKSKRGLPWTEHVIHRGQIYMGFDADDLAWAFDDHEKLVGLGLGSVINTPIVLGGRCLGTFNVLHEPGWYRQSDAQVTSILGHLALPALLADAVA